MAYKPDDSEPMARSIAHLLSGGLDGLWGFDPGSPNGNYELDEDLIGHRTDDPRKIFFLRSTDAAAKIEFANMTPRDLEDIVFGEPTVLRSRNVESVSYEVLNYDNIVPQDWSYSGTFGNIVTEEESVKVAATLTASTEFGTGDGSPVSAKQKFSLSITSAWGRQRGEQDSKSNTFTFGGSGATAVPPGVDMRFTAIRTEEDWRGRISGVCTFDHDIRIGIHAYKKGRGTRWLGYKYWSSVDDLLACCDGTAPIHWDLAQYFESHPPDPAKVDAIRKRARIPFVQDFEYSDMTVIRLRPQVLRSKRQEEALELMG